jgi:colanic acid biosynthesis glycosyl transferase WcaI
MSKAETPIRVAILSQYFPPEGGASSARIRFLAQSLKAAGMQVKVITAMPCYPEGRTYPAYRGKLLARETLDGIEIYRSWAYARPARSTLNRVLNYFSFAVTSLLWLRLFRNVDVIIFSQGPMFAGLVGFLAGKIYRKPIVFDVRDLWPDRIWEAGALSKGASSVAPLLRVFERFMYRNSAAVVGVTQGLCGILKQRVPKRIPVHLIRNSAQITNRAPATQTHPKGLDEPIVIVESGTQGLYQDPVTLARAFSMLKESCRRDVELRFYGDGPRVPELLKAVKNIPGAEYLGHQAAEQLSPLLRQADIGVVTLQPAELNKLAISRRVFDYAAAGLAIVYCGDGEGADIVKELNAGLVVPAGNVSALAETLLRLVNSPDHLLRIKCSSHELLRGQFSDQLIARRWVSVTTSINKSNSSQLLSTLS